MSLSWLAQAYISPFIAVGLWVRIGATERDPCALTGSVPEWLLPQRYDERTGLWGSELILVGEEESLVSFIPYIGPL